MNKNKLEKLKRVAASQASESQRVNSIDWEKRAVWLFRKGLIPNTMLETEIRTKHFKNHHSRMENFTHGN